ncbi:hypothetical protein LWI28_029261 [Acer negundo]|uniref:Protein CROWDED NUCLEI 4-like n=1 Tax=Acer negundo TaxID=4023 RepID=A0AAD5IKV9_ACENE|nr:hypothetical protein LWI28_029261 [Acer negundo]KAK4843884.1 hypothetical protein QYF36_013919 [Acer negundo]
MASPSSGRLAITPNSRVLQSPLSDDRIWRRLKDAGLDEEAIKRRDKAALIAYIAKLETEIYDHQHHMGLLILERKELASKFEQIKASFEAAEVAHKRDQAAHLSAIAEARKREECLKKAVGVEKECIISIEKSLHELRAEAAETKVAAESKFAEARGMVENAQKKFVEADSKLHAAESLQAEANRYHRAAERKLQEVEAREEDLSRRIISFKSDCEEKEKEIVLERQSLSERKNNLQQEHESLLDAQTLLNQREDLIFSRSQELSRLEKEIEASRASVEEKFRALQEEKSNLELTVASLSEREEAVIKREALLNKREQELLVSQGKLASKESNEIQKVIANHESTFRLKKSEFEAELEMNRKVVEDEIETKRRAWELKEMDLSQREDALREREHDLEMQSRAMSEKEKDLTERSLLFDDKEKTMIASEKEVELSRSLLQKEKEEISKMKLSLQKSLSSLDDKKKQVDFAKEKLEAMKCESDELSILEMKLKEELDMVRAQKLELMAEVDKLQIEKAKFEAEWEFIDEKRVELQKEAERVAVEREAVSKFLKDERDSLRKERDAMRNQHKQDVESLNCEREEFMDKMVHEHSEWFSKIQKERADFLLGIEMQKRELENCVEKRGEELQSSLSEREKTFEEEKKRELEHISSLKEKAEKEIEQVTLEMKRLDAERMEINLDRQRRDREWAELNNSIEELKVQRQKLEKQRELLHADREEIQAEIEQLKKLEDLKIAMDYMAVSKMQNSRLDYSQQKNSAKRYSKQQAIAPHINSDSPEKFGISDNGNGFSSPPVQKQDGISLSSSARFSWIKRCTDMIFKHSPETPLVNYQEKSLASDHEDAGLTATSSKRQHMGHTFGEPKVILEVPSEIKYDDTEQCMKSINEGGIQVGRKRRVDNHVSDDCVDPLEVQRQNNKKRRQQQDAPTNPSEGVITHSVISKELNMSQDRVSTKTQGVSEETSVLIIDKIRKISEVTCEMTNTEMTDTDNFANQEIIDHLHDPVPVQDPNSLKDGVTNAHSNSTNVEHAVCPCVSEAEELTVEVQLGNVKQDTESNQKDISRGGDDRLKEHDLTQSNRVEEIVANRTRSKQKA